MKKTKRIIVALLACNMLAGSVLTAYAASSISMDDFQMLPVIP